MNYRYAQGLVIVVFVIFLFSAAFIMTKSDSLTGMSVAEKCEISCYTDADCNDTDVCTKDVCMLPGKCSSQCFNKEIPGCTSE